MSEYKPEMTCSEMIVDNMNIHARATIKSFFPNNVDGLKLVQRRILWNLKTSTEYQKCATVTGNVIKTHPHSNGSIDGSIYQLAQPFSNLIPLIFSESGVGTYTGTEPCASRYVDVHSGEFARDLFFNNTNAATMIFVTTETEVGMEPAYFIPALPYALMNGSFGLGTGFRTESCAIGFHDLCQLTIAYIKLRSEDITWNTKLHTLAKYLIPDFPSFGMLRNKSYLTREYADGNFDAKIVVDGTLEVFPSSIEIHSISPGAVNLLKIREAAIAELQNKDSFLSKHVITVEDYAGKSHGSESGNLTFEFKRGENPFESLEEIKKLARFTRRWAPSPFYVDDTGTMRHMTPWELLDTWYTIRYNSVLGDLKNKQSKLIMELRQLNALIVVADHAQEVSDIMIRSASKEEAMTALCKRFDLSQYQAGYLVNLQLKQLTSKGRDELCKEKEAVAQRLAEFQKEFLHIPQLIIGVIEKLDEKYTYKYPRKCVLPSWIGYVLYKDLGIIQVSNMKEFDRHCKVFGSENVKLFSHSAPPVRDYMVNRLKVQDDAMEDHPKEFCGTVMYRLAHVAKYYACMTDDRVCILNNPPSSAENTTIVPISNKFVVVYKNGTASLETVTPEQVTKNLVSRGVPFQNVEFISPLDDDEFCVVHVNTAETNRVKIDRVFQTGKLSKIVVGTWKVVGVYSTKRPILLTVPDEGRSRTPIRHVYLSNVSDYFDANGRCSLQLGKRCMENGPDLVPYARKSEIWTLKK